MPINAELQKERLQGSSLRTVWSCSTKMTTTWSNSSRSSPNRLIQTSNMSRQCTIRATQIQLGLDIRVKWDLISLVTTGWVLRGLSVIGLIVEIFLQEEPSATPMAQTTTTWTAQWTIASINNLKDPSTTWVASNNSSRDQWATRDSADRGIRALVARDPTITSRTISCKINTDGVLGMIPMTPATSQCPWTSSHQWEWTHSSSRWGWWTTISLWVWIRGCKALNGTKARSRNKTLINSTTRWARCRTSNHSSIQRTLLGAPSNLWDSNHAGTTIGSEHPSLRSSSTPISRCNQWTTCKTWTTCKICKTLKWKPWTSERPVSINSRTSCKRLQRSSVTHKNLRGQCRCRKIRNSLRVRGKSLERISGTICWRWGVRCLTASRVANQFKRNSKWRIHCLTQSWLPNFTAMARSKRDAKSPTGCSKTSLANHKDLPNITPGCRWVVSVCPTAWTRARRLDSWWVPSSLSSKSMVHRLTSRHKESHLWGAASKTRINPRIQVVLVGSSLILNARNSWLRSLVLARILGQQLAKEALLIDSEDHPKRSLTASCLSALMITYRVRSYRNIDRKRSKWKTHMSRRLLIPSFCAWLKRVKIVHLQKSRWTYLKPFKSPRVNSKRPWPFLRANRMMALVVIRLQRVQHMVRCPREAILHHSLNSTNLCKAFWTRFPKISVFTLSIWLVILRIQLELRVYCYILIKTFQWLIINLLNLKMARILLSRSAPSTLPWDPSLEMILPTK